MASHAMRPEIGVVGAMLYYPDDTIQHAGIILGVGGVAGHAHKRLPRGTHGYFSRARLLQNFSAVTAACMILRKTVFFEAKGLDPVLGVAFNDVDFCLRVGKLGYRIVWTPHAALYHMESVSRGDDNRPEVKSRFMKEIRYMQQKWTPELANDPAYNPNLSLMSEQFALAFPHVRKKPWLYFADDRATAIIQIDKPTIRPAAGKPFIIEGWAASNSSINNITIEGRATGTLHLVERFDAVTALSQYRYVKGFRGEIKMEDNIEPLLLRVKLSSGYFNYRHF
jgi:GT2 family glycosyltransferase